MLINKDHKLGRLLNQLDYILVSISAVVCSLCSFIYSVYAKKYVAPLEYGIFTTCLLLQTYLNYAQFGTMNSYNRDYAQYLGANRLKDAAKLKNTTFNFLFLIYTILLFVVDIVVLIAYRNDFEKNYYFSGYFICPLIVLLETISAFCLNTERMEGHNNYTALVNFIKTVAAIIAGLVAIKKWGYYGLYVMPITAPVISIIFYFKSSVKQVKIEIEKKVLVNSIKTGFPLLVNSLVWTIMSSVDKFVILFFMTTEDLGIYSVPLMGFSTMVIIPQTVSQIFYYRISALYGRTKSTDILIEQCNKYTVVTSALTGITVVVAYYSLPIFVSLFMPNYKSGIFPAQILIIGVSIYSTTMLYSNIFSVLKMNKDLLINTVLLCIFNIIFSVTFVVINGYKVQNVAVGTSISYFLYSVILLLHISKCFHYSLRKLAFSSWLPVMVTIIPCLIFDVLFSSDYIALLVTILISGFISLLIFCLNRKNKYI